MYVLTVEGIKECDFFLAECRAKRKEILDAGLDTAEDTVLPDLLDILSDLECFADEEGYYNCWGVTDSYNSDRPLELIRGKHFIETEN